MSSRPERVLLADRERNVLRVLSDALEQQPRRQVDVTEQRAEMLRMARAGDYDLVIFDLALGGEELIAVLAELRASLPGAAIMILSAHGSVEDAVKALSHGASDYVLKPVWPDELRERVDAVLGNATGPRTGDYETLVAEARAALLDDDLQGANQRLARALASAPSRPEAFNLLGVAAEIDGARQQARAFYRAALALSPSHEPAYRNLARSVHVPADGVLDLGGGLERRILG